MAKIDIKIKNPKIDNIIKNIGEIQKKDFKLLSASGFSIQPYSNYTTADIETLIEDTVRVLGQLALREDILFTLNGSILTSLDTTINNLLSQFNSISGLAPNQLTNQHHGCLNQFQALNNALRQFAIYSMLTPSIDVPKIESDLNTLKNEASSIVKDAQENAQIIRNLIPEATATSLSVALDEIAQKLRLRVAIWLGVVITVLISTAWFSWYFFELNAEKEDYLAKKKQEVGSVTKPINLKNKADSLKYIDSIAKIQLHPMIDETPKSNSDNFVYWLKRIIIFFPIFYLIIFCIKQYNKERKLLEIYVHKKAIGQTLPAYMKQAEKPEIKDEILLRGATMIFTLPENPDSPIQGSDGIGLEEIKSILDIKDKLQK